MNSSEDILQFHFNSTTWNNTVQKIIPNSLGNLIENRIVKLHRISEKIGTNFMEDKGSNMIPHVYHKFKRYLSNGNEIFDRKNLRTLTYALTYSEQNMQTIFNKENELEIVLVLIENNWRDNFLPGLIKCLLSNWDTSDRKSLEKLEQFISTKLNNYTGNRSSLISFKTNKHYIDIKNGDLKLGATISQQKKLIHQATDMLCVPESWFSYSYFSKVISTYYERNKTRLIFELDYLKEALLKHDSSVTNKILISKMIIQANQPEFAVLQDKIKELATQQIGDPNNISKWSAFKNASDQEKSELFIARNILNEWITRQFINVFFNVCINDDRRKKFWLRFASKISSFNVYGPQHTKSILKRDQRIAEYVDDRFKKFTGNKDTSAFILYIGNHMLIEFSDSGYASIAYKINSVHKPNLMRALNSADDLRNSSMPMAIEPSHYNEEGRLFHKDGKTMWESKFNNWINLIVLR